METFHTKRLINGIVQDSYFTAESREKKGASGIS